eukprot:gene45629-56855_t
MSSKFSNTSVKSELSFSQETTSDEIMSAYGETVKG